MKNTIKILAIICAMLLTLTILVSCTDSGADSTLQVNVSVLNGTTGFGAAKLISDSEAGNAYLNYNFTVESDASLITAGLLNGSIDIAALPTNAAANLYNQSSGKIKIVAVNTLGVLYVVANGDKVNVESLADLDGMTVYCPAQNPAFIFEAVCRSAGINVTIDTAYAQPADLRTAVAAGQVDIAVLPEPMVTIAKSANDKLVTALDLTEEWEKINGANSLAQGCIVVRTEWAEAHPAELSKFMEEYKASVEFTVASPAEASELIVSTGVFAGKAAVAAKAIPNCNIVYLDGDEMASALDVFFEKLYDVKPQAVGGKLPDSGIYYKK